MCTQPRHHEKERATLERGRENPPFFSFLTHFYRDKGYWLHLRAFSANSYVLYHFVIFRYRSSDINVQTSPCFLCLCHQFLSNVRGMFAETKAKQQNVCLQSKCVNKVLIDTEMDRCERLNAKCTKAKKINCV